MIAIDNAVAGRGIDIPNVSLVTDCELSKTIKDYIHQIGWAGRTGELKAFLTFLDESQKFIMQMSRGSYTSSHCLEQAKPIQSY